ncbi:MAG: cytochrome b/b6 domain-containing protein [Deltaproteobacteria bacterium]|nr:cytochrome b/b6 domain-containing protein [Deltaproteobacteria bacterium]MBZ0219914.1 cytochrome b/b6 domain-containing protein [Deltaproteobacteria bacterium]
MSFRLKRESSAIQDKMGNSFRKNSVGYTLGAIVLHWASAVLIAAAFAIGAYMVTLAFSPSKLKLFSYHKWAGITIFLLAVIRLGWRSFNPPPPLPDGMPHWERNAARASHLILYALMLAVPLTGWLMSSAHGFQTVFLGILPLPDLVTRDKALAEWLELVHFVMNKALLAAVAVHIMAALKHHFIDRDDVLRRILGLRTLAGALLLIAMLPDIAASVPIVKEDSRIDFISRQMGVPIKGGFGKFDADVVFDPADAAKSKAMITIYLDSIDAGSDEATVEIKRKSWFDTANHPRAEFRSTSVKETGPGRYVVSGVMAIKGREKQVSAPFTAKKAGDSWVFEGKFIIKRLDFGIGEGAWSDTGTVADEVEILFRFRAPAGKK